MKVVYVSLGIAFLGNLFSALAVAATYRAADYFPLTPGERMSFLIGSNEPTDGATMSWEFRPGSVGPEGTTVVNEMWLDGNEPRHFQDTSFLVNDSGVSISSSLGRNAAAEIVWFEEYDPSLIMVPDTMHDGMEFSGTVAFSGQWEVGEEWAGSCTRNGQVVGLEQVTVPAGTFETLHLMMNDQSVTEDSSRRYEESGVWEFWLVEGIGPVKMYHSSSMEEYTLAGGLIDSHSTWSTMQAVPEPSSLGMALIGVPLATLVALRRRGGGRSDSIPA